MGEDVALEFTADVEAAVANVRELAAACQELAGTAKEAADGVAGLAAPATEAGDAVKGIADSSTAADGSLATLRGALEENTGAVTQLTDATLKLKDAQAEAAAAAEKAGTANESSAKKSGAAAESGLGKYKMALVGVAVGTAVAVDAAGKFQDATTHLVTDAGETQLAKVQQGILAVSAQTGTSANDITNAMYHIDSAGFHVANGGLQILKTAAEGAKVGGADLDTTSRALVGTLTAYYGTSLNAGQATKDSTALMNELITTVGSGDMRMQDLASSMSAVTPIAAANHISFAQVGGAIATMTSQGMTARQATQDLAHAIRSLTSPTNVQSVEMKAMGLNANDVAKNLGKTGLAGTLNEMRDAVLANTRGGNVMLDMLKGMSPAAQGLADKILAGTITTKDLTSAMKTLSPEQYALVSRFKTTATSVTGMQQTYTSAMSKMLGGATGLNVALMLTGTHMGDLTKSTAAIAAEGKKASDTVDNWSKIQGTFKFKMDQAKASLEDTGIALGSALLPAVTAILGPLAHFLALIAGNKAAAIAFAVVIGSVLAGAIGTKAVKAVTEFKSAVETTVGGVSKLVKAITGIGGAQKAAADAADASAAVQEADAAEVAVANDEAAAESSGSWVASAARAVAAAAVWVAQSVAKVAVVVASNVAGAATTLGAWVATGAGMVAQGAVWVAGMIAKAAVVVASNVAGAAVTAAAWLAANAVMLLGIGLVVALVALAVYEIIKHWHSIVHGVAEAFDAVRHAVAVAVDAVVGFVKSHWQLLLGILTGPIGLAVALISKYWSTIVGDAERFAADVRNTISKFASDVFGFFERMATDVTGAERRMISDVINDVKRWISDWISTVTSGLDSVAHLFQVLPGRILSFLESLPGDMMSIGQNIIHGLVNGIMSMGSFLVNSIESLIPSPIRGIVQSALGIFSPSTVFHGFGVNIVQGLINGVRAMQGQLAGAMSGLAGGVTSAGSAYAAGAVAPAAGGTSLHLSMPMTVQGGTGYDTPQFRQYLQGEVQEAVLRYDQLNAGNGLTSTWGR